MLAPHRNIMRKTNIGEMVQNHSRRLLPRIRGVRSSSARRRYLTAKYSSSSAIDTAMMPVTAQRKKNSVSTRSAVVEACSGNRGTSANISRPLRKPPASPEPQRRASPCLSLAPPACCCALAPPCQPQQRPQHDDRERAGRPHQIHHRHGVFARLRVIAVAEQQRPIDHRRADLVLRRLHQTQTEVAREGPGSFGSRRAMK